jgi:hypothetical protein
MNTDTMSLEDFAAAYKEADNSETTSKMLQGQIVKQAIDAGRDPDEVCNFIAVYVRKSGRTVYRRYQTSRTFQLYDASVNYDLYAAAASIVDYRVKDEDKIAAKQQEAQEWVERAIVKEWSPADLRKAIKGKVVSHNTDFHATVGDVREQDSGVVVVLCLDEMPPVKAGDKVKLRVRLEAKREDESDV